MRLVVNCRFRGRPITGVERFAECILRDLGTPFNPLQLRALPGIPGAVTEVLAGGRDATGTLLWSPCNFGPPRLRNQVVTLHDVSSLDRGDGFSLRYRAATRLRLELIVRRVRHVATVSDFSRGRILEHFPFVGDRVSVIPPGADSLLGVDLLGVDLPGVDLPGVDLPGVDLPGVDLPGVDLPGPAGPDGAAPYLVCLGSGDPRKRLDDVIRAFEGARLGRLGALHLVGGTNQAVFRPSPSSVPTGSGVIRRGRLTDRQLRALLMGSRGLVTASDYEGYGLAAAEASALGVPVIASLIPAHLEQQLGHHFFEVGDLGGLSQLMRAALVGGLAPPDGTVRTWRQAAAEYEQLFARLGVEPGGGRLPPAAGGPRRPW